MAVALKKEHAILRAMPSPTAPFVPARLPFSVRDWIRQKGLATTPSSVLRALKRGEYARVAWFTHSRPWEAPTWITIDSWIVLAGRAPREGDTWSWAGAEELARARRGDVWPQGPTQTEQALCALLAIPDAFQSMQMRLLLLTTSARRGWRFATRLLMDNPGVATQDQQEWVRPLKSALLGDCGRTLDAFFDVGMKQGWWQGPETFWNYPLGPRAVQWLLARTPFPDVEHMTRIAASWQQQLVDAGTEKGCYWTTTRPLGNAAYLLAEKGKQLPDSLRAKLYGMAFARGDLGTKLDALTQWATGQRDAGLGVRQSLGSDPAALLVSLSALGEGPFSTTQRAALLDRVIDALDWDAPSRRRHLQRRLWWAQCYITFIRQDQLERMPSAETDLERNRRTKTLAALTQQRYACARRALTLAPDLALLARVLRAWPIATQDRDLPLGVALNQLSQAIPEAPRAQALALAKVLFSPQWQMLYSTDFYLSATAEGWRRASETLPTLVMDLAARCAPETSNEATILAQILPSLEAACERTPAPESPAQQAREALTNALLGAADRGIYPDCERWWALPKPESLATVRQRADVDFGVHLARRLQQHALLARLPAATPTPRRRL